MRSSVSKYYCQVAVVVLFARVVWDVVTKYKGFCSLVSCVLFINKSARYNINKAYLLKQNTKTNCVSIVGNLQPSLNFFHFDSWSQLYERQSNHQSPNHLKLTVNRPTPLINFS